jgi:hypothetical protein
MVSLLVRPSGIARALEARNAAAARWLREARSVELQVFPKPLALELVVSIGFESQQRADLAAAAFRVLWTVVSAHGKRPANDDAPVEVVGDTLILRLGLRAPAGSALPADPGLVPTESSAQ